VGLGGNFIFTLGGGKREIVRFPPRLKKNIRKSAYARYVQGEQRREEKRCASVSNKSGLRREDETFLAIYQGKRERKVICMVSQLFMRDIHHNLEEKREFDTQTLF